MARRGIPPDWLDSVLDDPEQRFPQSDHEEVLQSRFTSANGRIYLVRAFVATDKEPPLVITVYRTSKIAKYWRPE
jgi:hypothetical protein